MFLHVCMLVWLLSCNCIIQWSIAVVYPLWLYLLHHRPVTSSQEVVSLVYQGMQHRAADSTLIHEHSSRSHLIVTISIECRGAELSDATSMSSLVTPAHSQDSTTTMVGNKKIRELMQTGSDTGDLRSAQRTYFSAQAHFIILMVTLASFPGLDSTYSVVAHL